MSIRWDDHVILDVAGVGYLVHCPSSTLARLHTGARAADGRDRITDETIKLYGFFTEEREWFRLLQTVQNVGGRVALNVLSALSPRDLERALALGDKAVIGRAQGVGPKLALRIVTELKDKAPSMMLRGRAQDAAVGGAKPRGPKPTRSRRWSSSAILKARRPRRWRAPRATSATARADTLIRESLRAMGR